MRLREIFGLFQRFARDGRDMCAPAKAFKVNGQFFWLVRCGTVKHGLNIGKRGLGGVNRQIFDLLGRNDNLGFQSFGGQSLAFRAQTGQVGCQIGR